jgi:hypothetical protein
LAESPTGIVPVGDTNLSFGLVQMKYDTCDNVAISDYVLFDITKARSIMFGSTIYYLVDEALCLFKEPPFP